MKCMVDPYMELGDVFVELSCQEVSTYGPIQFLLLVVVLVQGDWT